MISNTLMVITLVVCLGWLYTGYAAVQKPVSQEAPAMFLINTVFLSLIFVYWAAR